MDPGSRLREGHAGAFASVIATVLLLGCNGGVRNDNPFDAAGESGGAGAGTSAGSAATSGASGPSSAGTSSGSPGSGAGPTGGSGAGDGGAIFDVAGPGGTTGAPGDGCKKIDFLFVVDNSASMGAHQQALGASFGPFMDTIVATVQAQDYHVMVVDSDGNQDDSDGCNPSGCPGLIGWCGNYCDVQAQMTACDYDLGAGVIQPYINEASNQICGVPGGKRYLSSDLSASQIEQLFPCIAKVGIFGSGAEMPTSAIVEALTTQAGPGACNDGFLRDDAILVVTFITDDYPVAQTADNASTVGSPQQWYDAVVAAKKGAAQNVVMLGIINTPDATCVSGAGDPIVHPTDRFMEFVGLFGDQGLTGNICASTYGDFFDQAVGLIDTACNDYVPAG